jgi:ABC-type tungstate transport system substrate-binding protein
MNTVNEAWGLAWSLLLQGDAVLWRTVGLSLQVSGLACMAGALIGLPLGAWLALGQFRGQGIVVGVLNTMLALPSVVVGLAVYLLLSRAGPLGSWGLLFTPGAMVVAQTVLVLPLIAALSRRLVLQAWAEGGSELQAWGARGLPLVGLLLWHERLALATLLLTAFGRAVSEVGAVMIVGGNIDGVTRVMTTTIALETSKGNLALALALGLVLLLVVGALQSMAALLAHQAQRLGAAPEALAAGASRAA